MNDEDQKTREGSTKRERESEGNVYDGIHEVQKELSTIRETGRISQKANMLFYDQQERENKQN